MIKLDKQILDTTSAKAKTAKRKRMNYNFHPVLEDPLQRMLNAVEPGTYIRPHKHENPDKTEVFMILRGRILVVEFDDQGNITDFMVLDAATENFAAEIPPRTWHTIISLEEGSIAYEIKNGPYDPIDDKNFATWAPPEGSPLCNDFIRKIIDSTTG